MKWVLLAVLLVAGCSGDDPVSPKDRTVKEFNISMAEKNPCGEAEATRLCIDLGYEKADWWGCKNDGTGIYIYKVRCSKP